MKKAISLLLVLMMALSLCACGKTDKNNTSSNTEADSQKVATKTVLCLTKIIYSNDNGDKVSNVSYTDNEVHITLENPVSGYDCIYAPDGKVLSEVRYNDEGVNSYNTTNTYNSDGQIVDHVIWDAIEDCLSSSASYFYNDEKQLIKQENKNRAHQITYYEYNYDDNGVFAEKYFRNGDGALREHYKFFTNDKGQLQKCIGYKDDFDGKGLREWGVYTYSYDSEGRLISKIWDKSIPGPARVSDYFEYGPNGEIAKSDYNGIKISYTYNEDGYLTSVTYDSGSTRTFVYGEVELTEAQAESALQWSKEGLIWEYVNIPENLLKDTQIR